MTRALLIATLALVGCAAPPAPTPTGQLLGAPATATVDGRVVTVQAAPAVHGTDVRVPVQVVTDRPPLPALRITDVSVVTGSGVWTGTVQERACAAGPCARAVALGRGAGLRAGQRVQVVVRVQDTAGRGVWLRAPETAIAAR